jgi:hypothetical protein
MDYGKATESINILLKTATPEGGSTVQYDKIPTIEAQRDLIVSHVKCTYTSDTGEMLNSKEFVDTSKNYKNMLTTQTNQVEHSKGKLKRLEENVKKGSTEVEKIERTTRILLILLITVSITIGLYLLGGQYAHSPAFMVLIAGFMIVLYTRGEKVDIDFLQMKQWKSTIPEQLQTFNDLPFQGT